MEFANEYKGYFLVLSLNGPVGKDCNLIAPKEMKLSPADSLWSLGKALMWMPKLRSMLLHASSTHHPGGVYSTSCGLTKE